MRRITVIGTGYVGLVTGACFAELGNEVHCFDKDASKIALLQAGKIPFFEPGLGELVQRNAANGRLFFHASAADSLRKSAVVFIAVGTPMGSDGHANLEYVRQAAREVADNLDRDKIVVNKSTVPVETGDLVAAIVREYNASRYGVQVVSNPEFLREGSAISDFMKPDRIVIGVENADALETMKSLYSPLAAPIIVTNVRTAEMIKYTANAFLATKISFINEIARICERVGADVIDVVRGAGADSRIGTSFMTPGIGFGGSCFPKDVMALSKIASASGVEPRILDAVLDVNRNQVLSALSKLESALGPLAGKRVALLGLAFKPNTDDIRESPAIALAIELASRGVVLSVHDPVAAENARPVLPGNVTFAADAYSAVAGADAVAVVTDWSEYKQIDLTAVLHAMCGNVLLDGRNIYDPVDVVSCGFRYVGFGRVRTALESPTVNA